MNMKKKVEKNKKSKENNLLESALYLFTQDDIHNVTVQQIVERAGVAKGTFYLYFHDKYEIRDVLIQKEASNLFHKALSQLDENDIRDFEDSVIFMINQVLIDLESQPILLKFIKRNLSWGIFQTHLKGAIDDEESNLVEDFRHRALVNGYTIKNPEIILYMIIELTGSACYNSILYQQPLPIQDFKPYLFDAIRSILRNYKN